ncbi:MAG: ABC transporter ATP-binding protein [Acidobacteriota bacterium]|nr:ABC transporter ATP-binding protein [Acidobacteriota bacterium]
MSDALVTRGLCRSFGSVTAVEDLSLTVPRGRITGFLGPNGAGKTTTLKMILGLLRPDAGTVEILGRDPQRQRREVLQRVGALIETPTFYPHLTGHENLELVRRVVAMPPARTGECLALVGLTEAAHRRAGGYSLGMEQRLGLALALLRKPELLILDEPTNGLDPAGMQEMRKLLGQLVAAEGVTLFLSSHLLAEVEEIASHLVVLRRGRAAYQGPTDQLRTAGEAFLQVGVTRAGEARQWLEREGWIVMSETAAQEAQEEPLRVAGSGRETAARLSAALVGAGFSLHHLSEHRPRLEARFLELTEGTGGEVSAPGSGDPV